jgi:hypothetical protein
MCEGWIEWLLIVSRIVIWLLGVSIIIIQLLVVFKIVVWLLIVHSYLVTRDRILVKLVSWSMMLQLSCNVYSLIIKSLVVSGEISTRLVESANGEWSCMCLMVSSVASTLVVVLVVLLIKKLVIDISLMVIGEKNSVCPTRKSLVCTNWLWYIRIGKIN